MTHSGANSDWESFIALLEPKSGERILDVGAGNGEKASRILQSFPGTEVYAVDPDEKKIAEARQSHPGVKSSVAAAESLPFEDSIFDKAYSTMALHHFADLDLALPEIERVLKRQGTYVVLEVEPGSLTGRLFRFFGRITGEHTNIMTQSECLARLKAAKGLEVVSSTGLGAKYLARLMKQ